MDLLRKIVLLCTFLVIADSVPPTCYSAVLRLSKGITELMGRLETFSITKRCLANLPKLYINVHNSCVMVKLRDHLYALDNLIAPQCRELKRIAFLKLRIKRLYNMINRVCYRDLVFFTDDCAELERPPPPPDPQEDLSK
ncbi:cytokine-like protein 1 [Stegostoma tigrinum]|uniref:cytokine-like protein 1 n=1 Tax=Stegostoma tigrinum TaxID=3053191 RepID=UPI00202B8114|nr:cytokine-like protein 1 [Stegostoma tigrinum]